MLRNMFQDNKIQQLKIVLRLSIYNACLKSNSLIFNVAV